MSFSSRSFAWRGKSSQKCDGFSPSVDMGQLLLIDPSLKHSRVKEIIVGHHMVPHCGCYKVCIGRD